MASPARTRAAPGLPFNVERYLETAGVKRRIVRYRARQVIFSQGQTCGKVFYLQGGRVKISVTSGKGKEAVIAVVEAGDFFGEACMTGQALRITTATAMIPVSVLEIEKPEMVRVIREESDFSRRFLAHMLKRNVRVEEDLVDQLFNSSEKRLARALLLVARYGDDDRKEKIVAHVSQATLAEMIGTTRGRVSFFMNKFRKLGFIRYNGELHINDSLLTLILRD